MSLCTVRHVLTGSVHQIFKYGNLKWKWFPPLSTRTTYTITPNNLSRTSVFKDRRPEILVVNEMNFWINDDGALSADRKKQIKGSMSTQAPFLTLEFTSIWFWPIAVYQRKKLSYYSFLNHYFSNAATAMKFITKIILYFWGLFLDLFRTWQLKKLRLA